MGYWQPLYIIYIYICVKVRVLSLVYPQLKIGSGCSAPFTLAAHRPKYITKVKILFTLPISLIVVEALICEILITRTKNSIWSISEPLMKFGIKLNLHNYRGIHPSLWHPDVLMQFWEVTCNKFSKLKLVKNRRILFFCFSDCWISSVNTIQVT